MTHEARAELKACFGYALQEGRRRSQMITRDEIQELLRSTETYRVERTTSTDERSKGRGQTRLDYALQEGRRREPTGDMDKFHEAICAFANDNGGNIGGKTGGKVGGDVVENIVGNIVENIIDVPACPQLCHKFCHKLCHKLIKGGKHGHKRSNLQFKGCNLG